MAVDNRPFKSKEQDGQGNEVIIRDQQLVEQGTATTMASGACFETRDVDDRPVKIPRDNMMNIVLECIGIILNDSSRNLGTNVQKALGLQGNTVGHSTVADFASVLGEQYGLLNVANLEANKVVKINNSSTYYVMTIIFSGFGGSSRGYKGQLSYDGWSNNPGLLHGTPTNGLHFYRDTDNNLYIKVDAGYKYTILIAADKNRYSITDLGTYDTSSLTAL